ncbi:Fe-S cluster assembly protein SufD [Alphaproteobacteria bacterium]|nr:Fe-S cluster assembly protein SufD [Alphaproteobacteria bacterium]
MQALDLKNLPTPKVEEWKYTNLPKAIPADLTPANDDEIVIHIPRGQISEQAEDILFTGSDKSLHTPRLKIVLEEGAQLTLIERHDGSGSYWKNMTTEITLGANARLHHYRMQDDDHQAVNTNMVHITMDRDSHYDGFSLNIGSKLSRHELHALLQGAGGECHFNGINLLNGKQHGDTTILIEHQAPHCQSNQFYRTLLDDQSRGVFQGKVHVHQIAQKTDGYQMSNALLLSPQAEMDTKPELEIYADDVLCSHGSTTGQLDEGPLFYLRSRGLSEAEARLLLMTAFIDEVTAKITDENFRFEIERHAHEWLKEALET